jgi:hypothetical protein
MTKGDAERAYKAKADKFTHQYKAGDIAFCPLYGYCRILKINKNTVSCVQVDGNGQEIVYAGSIFRSNQGKAKPMLVEKYLFNLKGE